MSKTNFIKKISKLMLVFFLSASGHLSTNAQDAQQTNITGTVFEPKSKVGLGGATVQLLGSTNTVVTDDKGSFKLTTYKKAPYLLSVSFIGYQSQEIKIPNNNAPLSITLQEAANQLSEIAVVGYGTQRRKELTGSIGTVAKENLAQITPSLDNLLQGAVAGVNVTQSSGQPGATSSIRIRGGNSLSFGNDPLYVIDGFIYYNDNNLTNLNPASGTAVTGVSTNGLATINPSDIESIDVLKDASATAIYGSRGANGVVIITTKKGTKGSNNISYNVSYGSQKVDKTIDVLNGQQWAKLFDDLYAATPTIQLGLAGNKRIIDSIAATGANGDWINAAIRTGITQNHQLSIYGGDDKSRYSLQGNYFDQQGTLIATDFKRYSARFNYEKNFTNKFKIGTSIFGSNSSENKLTGTAFNSIGFGNAFSSLYLNNPLQTVKNDDGSYNTTLQGALNSTVNTINGQQYSDNAILGIESIANQTKLSRILGNFSAEYKILDGITLKTTFGTDILNTKLNYFAPSYTAAGNSSGTIAGSGSIGTINYLGWLNENTITYDHSFDNKHFINLLGGFTTQYQKSENTFLAGQSFPSDALSYNNLYLATANKVTGSGEAKQTWNSWLGRISYSFEHRYNLTVSGRYDGASTTGVNNKWGFFPSVGFSWNASDETFLKRFDKTISNLKLRLSAGSAGNANFPAYSSIATINPNGYYFGTQLTAVNGLSPSQPSNPDLTWETTTQYNGGIDLGLFNNKITVTADVYYKKTTNLFISGGGLIPLSTGYASASQNIGSLDNKGIELAITSENIKTINLSWKTTIIFAKNSSTILSLGPSKQFAPVAPTGQVSPVLVKVGLPVGTFWGYKTDGLLTTADVYGGKAVPKLAGVSQQTGDRKYLHADGVTGNAITTADKQNLGSAQPKFTGSFSSTLTYKNFDFNFLFQGSYGNKIFNLLQQQLEKTTTTQNVSTVLLDRWDSIANPNGKFPKVVNAPVVQVQDTYIEDGSYLRLKNIVIGYTFPKDLAKKIGAKQVRLTVSAQNVLTITNYSGTNPEANFYDQNNLQPGIDFGVYPNYRTYLVGVAITF